jgi:hypothetical protein
VRHFPRTDGGLAGHDGDSAVDIIPALTLRSCALAASVLLCACAPTRPRDWYREIAPAPAELEAAWAPYHWYVVDVKYDFQTRLGWEGMHLATQSFTDLYLVVKALTQEGSQIGTLNIPSWNQSLQDIEAVLLDSNGRQVPVDGKAVRATYQAKGMVVLPRVTRGCVVAVHIRQGPFTVLDYWEYPLAGPTPAYRSTFSFTYPRALHYRFGEYNGLKASEPERKGREIVRRWSAENVLPMAEVPFLDAAGARPRLVITREDRPGGYPDWAAVAERRAKEFFSRTRVNRKEIARKKAQELIALAVSARAVAAGPSADSARRDISDSAKAALLLEWVQDNIGPDPDAPDLRDPDKVLETRRGNMWQTASLLDEMFSAAGLKSHLVLTRDREQGGLDSNMVAPDAAWEPLVVVRAGGREWAACPHLRAYGFGDYPPGLFGMAALSLDDKAVRPLPEPAHPAAVMTETQELPLEGTRDRRLAVDLSGPFAALARARFFAGQAGGEADTLDFCRNFLRAIGFAASVRSCAESNMERRNQPLRLSLTLDPPAAPVERAGARQWSLTDLFSRPAWFYDSARVEDYYFPFEQIRRQSAVFPKPAHGRLEVEIPCRESDRGPLKVTCKRAEEDGKISVTRETVIRSGRFSSAALRKEHESFAGLDRAGESKATLR